MRGAPWLPLSGELARRQARLRGSRSLPPSASLTPPPPTLSPTATSLPPPSPSVLWTATSPRWGESCPRQREARARPTTGEQCSPLRVLGKATCNVCRGRCPHAREAQRSKYPWGIDPPSNGVLSYVARADVPQGDFRWAWASAPTKGQGGAVKLETFNHFLPRFPWQKILCAPPVCP